MSSDIQRSIRASLNTTSRVGLFLCVFSTADVSAAHRATAHHCLVIRGSLNHINNAHNMYTCHVINTLLYSIIEYLARDKVKEEIALVVI